SWTQDACKRGTPLQACGSAFPFERQGRLLQSPFDFGAIFPFTLFRPTTSLSTLRSGRSNGRAYRYSCYINILLGTAGWNANHRPPDFRCPRFSSSSARPAPPGISPARLAAPTNKWPPAHYFGRPRGKAWPALNLLGGHPRAGARLRSLFVLAEAGPRRGP